MALISSSLNIPRPLSCLPVLEINSAQRILRMRQNIFRKRQTMITAADTTDRARPIAAALVEREERTTRSRMTAYDRVASRIGVSASWLQKLIGRRHVAIAAHEFFNLYAAYQRLCERVEADAEHERRLLIALKDQTHAALSCLPLEMDPTDMASLIRERAHSVVADDPEALAQSQGR